MIAQPSIIMANVLIPPFDPGNELVANDTTMPLQSPSIPNEPCINGSQACVDEFLHKELSCPVLDELYPYLHLFEAKKSTHITSLHDQIVKGRSVLIAEKPALHLIWYYKMIFIKPIPHCLLNSTFWEQYLCPSSGVQQGNHLLCASTALSPTCRAALGFLRTYTCLIQHESDFRIAKASHLVPDHVSYTAFQIFIEPFRHIPDDAVTLRYQYGQMRLTRLNWAVRIFRPASLRGRRKLHYRNLYIQTGQYLERFGAPLLFLFASLTLILSSMQVALAAKPEGGSKGFSIVSWGFSVAVIIFIVGLSVMGFVFVVLLFSRKLAFRIQLQRRQTGEILKNQGF
jgi:hypothetical protein